MMKIQKICSKVLPVLLLAAVCCGCKKENTNSFRIGLEDFEGNGGKKVYFDHNTKIPHFELDDKLRINGGTYVITDFKGEWAMVDWISGADAGLEPYYGVYPASAVTGALDANSTVTFTLPSQQFYYTTEIDGEEYQKLTAPMCAVAQTNQITFRNVCSVMEIRITNNTGDTRYIDSIEVSADSVQLCGAMTVSGFGTETPSLVAGAPSSGNNKVRLYGMGSKDGKLGKRINSGATAYYYIYLPTYSKAKLKVRVFANSHGIKYKSDTLVQPVYGKLVRNKVFTVPFSLDTIQENGFDPVNGGGGFTVRLNSDGSSAQRGYLAYGNLFHDANKVGVPYKEWYNAPYQFSMNATHSGGNVIDQFTYSQGIGNNYGVKATSNGKYTQTDFSDWGYTIDATGGWRTLSGEEWHVLVWDRPNAANLYGYGKITGIPADLQNHVNGVDPTYQVGCFFLPDNWKMPQAVLTSHGGDFVGSSTTFATNSYTLINLHLETLRNEILVFLQ